MIVKGMRPQIHQFSMWICFLFFWSHLVVIFSKPPTSKKGLFSKKAFKTHILQASWWVADNFSANTGGLASVRSTLKFSRHLAWAELGGALGLDMGVMHAILWGRKLKHFDPLKKTTKRNIEFKCPIWSLVLVITWICCVKRWFV